MLPPWPGWDGLHPLVIHFPIALLMIAPLFVALALAWRQHSAGFSYAALVLLALGTISTYVAISTGQAAGQLAEHTDAINAVISQHEELAETTSITFSAITTVYALFTLLPAAFARFRKPSYAFVGNLVFLVVIGAATLLVVNTAHQGGRLVHQLGVHAIVASPPSAN